MPCILFPTARKPMFGCVAGSTLSVNLCILCASAVNIEKSTHRRDAKNAEVAKSKKLKL